MKQFLVTCLVCALAHVTLAGCVQEGGNILDKEVDAAKLATINNNIRTSRRLLSLERSRQRTIALEYLDVLKKTKAMKKVRADETARIKKLDAQVHRVRQYKAKLSGQKAGLDKETGKIQAAINAAKARSKQLSAELAKIRRENDSISGNIAANNRTKAAKQKELSDAQAALAALNTKLAVAQKKKLALDGSLAIIKGNKSRIEKNAAAHQKAINDLVTRIKGQEVEIAGLNADVKKKSAELAALRAKLAALQKQIDADNKKLLKKNSHQPLPPAK